LPVSDSCLPAFVTKGDHVIRKTSTFLTAATLALCFFASTCQAHKITVYAWMEGDTISGQAAYNDGSYAKSCRVEVLENNGNIVSKTVTDMEGNFSCRLPHILQFPVKVIINDGMGHRDQYTIGKDDRN